MATEGEAPTDSVDHGRSRDGDIRRELTRLASSAFTVGAGAVSLVAAAHFIGWSTARAFFETLGNEWVLPFCSALDLFAFAWTPAALLLVFFFLAMWDVLDTPKAWVLQSPTGRFFLPAAVFFLLAYTVIAVWQPDPAIRLVLGVVILFAWMLSAAEALAILVAFGGGANTGSIRFYGLAFLLASVFFFVPTAAGQLRALRDSSPERSSLPCVELIDHSGTAQERLLHAAGSTAFLVELDEEGPTVRAVPITAIRVLSRAACRARAAQQADEPDVE